MASVSRDNKGWRILFADADGIRRTLRLGKVDRKAAESIRGHVEALLVAKTTGQPVRQETAAWLAGLGNVLRERLARAGLAPEPKPSGLRLGDAVEQYLTRRTPNVKPASMVAVKQALANAVEFFGANKRLEEVTPGDADDFAGWLCREGRSRVQVNKSPGLRPATAQKRIERVRAFFRDAVRRRLIAENPFEGIKPLRVDDADRQAYVPAEVVDRLIAETPSLEWKALLAMSRYLGVRVPSEPFSMTWDCVDWERGLLRIPSPKTAVHGKDCRIAPLVPPVRKWLEALFDAAPAGQVYVFHELRQRDSTKAAERGWWRAVNLRQHLLRLITRIGEKPWPRLWHSLRASAQTDLSARFPAHVVSAWLGNTVAVAAKHYLRVTPADFERAAKEPWRGVSGDQVTNVHHETVAQNPTRQTAEMGGILRKLPSQPIPQSVSLQQVATHFFSVHPPKVAAVGLEPTTRGL